MPQDAFAMSVRCDYCTRENPLPAEILALRQRQQREAQAAHQAAQIFQEQQQTVKTGRRIGLWITLFSVLPAIIIPLVIVFKVTSSVDDAMSQTNAAFPNAMDQAATARAEMRAAQASAEAAAARAGAKAQEAMKPKADVKPAETRMKAMLKERDALGCRILLPPESHEGTTGFTANLGKGSTCAVFLAVGSAPDQKLTVALTTPFKDTVPSPPATSEVTFPYCATTKEVQPHELKVTPSSDDPFVVAGLACPQAVALGQPAKPNVAPPPPVTTAAKPPRPPRR
jgi:hypothetical protein